MKFAISKVSILNLVIFLCISSLTNISVYANTTDTKIELVIDESIGDVSDTFDTIGRFSHSGIAKIGKISETQSYEDEYGQTQSYDVYKYGLMNIRGEVLLEPIYDEISDYNDEFYSIRKYVTENNNFFVKEGLVSKSTGKIIIEPVYDWIPDLDSKMLMLYRTSSITQGDEVTYQTFSEIKSNKDGVIEDVKVPNNISLDKYEWMYVDRFIGNLNLIIGVYKVTVGNNTYYKQESWVVDEYGDALNDYVFNYMSGYLELNGSIFFSTRTETSLDGSSGESGLYKLTLNESKYDLEQIIGPSDGYDYIWIDEYQEVARYSKYNNDYYNWGYYNLTSGVFVDESNYNNYVNSYPVRSLDGVKIQYTCGEDETGLWECELKALEDGTDINLIEGLKFNSYNDQYDGYLILYNYEQCEDTMSNVLYKDDSGHFKLLFDENVTGYLNLYNNQYFVANTWGENARLTIKKMVNNQPISIVENKANAWFYTQNDILTIYSRDMSIEDEYVQQYTLFDLKNNSIIVEDVYDLSFMNANQNDIPVSIGSYRNSDSEKVTFIYKNGTFNTIDVKSKYISQINQDGTIMAYDYMNYECNTYIYNQETQEYTYGLGSCSKYTQSMFDLNGTVIAEDYDYISRLSNQKSLIGYKSTYNDEYKYYEYTSQDYIYYDPNDSEGQFVRTFAGNNRVLVDNNGLALLTKNGNVNIYTFVKNGVLLQEVNTALVGANRIGSFSDSTLVYSKFSTTNPNEIEIYIINELGESFKIPYADDFEGKTVRIKNAESGLFSWFYVDIVPGENSSNELLLTPLPSLIQNRLRNLSNQFYTYDVYELNNNYQGKGLFFSTFENETRTFTVVGQSEENPNGMIFSGVEPIENSALYSITTLDSRKGVIDSSGQIIINPNDYVFSYFSVQNNFIYAYDWTQTNSRMTLFDLTGRNLLESEEYEDIYFNYVSTDNLKNGYFMAYRSTIVDGNYLQTPYLYSYKDDQATFIGNYYTNKINDTIYEYRDYTQTNIGLMNNNFQVIVSIDKGNRYFSFDSKNRLISGGKYINGSYVPGGLYTYEGLELLDGYYSPRWNYDSFNSYNNTMDVDSRGYLKIIYDNPSIKDYSYYGTCINFCQTTCTCQEYEYSYHQSRPYLYNFYDLQNHRLLYPNPVSSDSISEDGFITVSELVEVEGSIEDDIANHNNYKTIERDGIIHKADYKSVVYNQNYDVVIPAGKYDYVYWDSSLSLVKVSNRYTERREDGNYAYNKYGLVDKLGNVVVEPKYETIDFDEELGMYKTTLNNWSQQGLIDSSGNIIAEAIYNRIEYLDKLNWLIMQKNIEVENTNDSSILVPVNVMDIYDLNTHNIKYENITRLDTNLLAKNGYTPIGFFDGIGSSFLNTWTDPNGVVHSHWYSEVFSKYGLIDKNGELLLEPVYSSVEHLANWDRSRMFEGIFIVSTLKEEHECFIRYYDRDSNRIIEDQYTCNQYLQGIYSVKDGFILEPSVNEFYEINTDGYIKTGNTEFKTYTCQHYYEELDTTVEETNSDYQQIGVGLTNIYTGKVLDPIYSEITTTYNRRDQWKIPPFDNNGYIKVTKYNYNDENGENGYYYTGLADKNGIAFDVKYQTSYYLNGYFYGSLNERTWEVVNAHDKADKYTINISKEDAYIKSVELVSNKVIVETLISDGFDQYSEYGVVFLNNDEFLPFEYTDISYDGKYWYLEKYNDLYGTYSKAIMDDNMNFILPFSDKYDSLSDFVGGYAIGQKGVAPETSSTGGVPLLNAFFLPVRAADDDYLLEIIDENGKVVADLRGQYESAQLLGEVDGVIKVLVKKNGKFYIADIVKTESELISITNISLSVNSLSLEVGKSYQLIGSIEPSNYTENIRSYWESLDDTIANVNSEGLVKAVKSGKTTIQYVVNGLVAQCDIEVFETKAPIKKVLDAPKSFKDNIELFNLFIHGGTTMDDKSFIRLIHTLYDSDKDFLSYLDYDDLSLVDDTFLRVFSEWINVESTKVKFPIKFVGLGLLVDLDSVLRGIKNNVDVQIKTELSDQDKELLNDYIKNYNVDSSNLFSLDISIERKINDQIEKLTDLVIPVQITISLPDSLKGVGDLEVIQIHNGEIQILPLYLNENGSASFMTSSFSSFTIVKAFNRDHLNPNNEVDKSSVIIKSNLTFIGLGIGALIGLLAFILKKYKAKSILFKKI